MGIRKTIDCIKGKQLNWYRRAQRMSEERVPKKVIGLIPTENRKKGSPKISWIEGIRKSVRYNI